MPKSTRSSILSVPHPTLRLQTTPIDKVDAQVLDLATTLAYTLEHKRDPRGVGLAAPQIGYSQSVFSTFLSRDEASQPEIRLFFNPVITNQSKYKTFGPNPTDPILEGCLSIPHIYGPVPRFEWIELEFDQLIDNALERTREKFDQYTARVIQHEFDHLQGVLFTDYTLQFELPLYDDSSGKLKEIDRLIAKKF